MCIFPHFFEIEIFSDFLKNVIFRNGVDAENFKKSKFDFNEFSGNNVTNIHRLPWDQNTVIGYIADICTVIFCTESYFICNGVFLMLFISLCLNYCAFLEMYQNTLRALDHPNKEHDKNEFMKNLITFHSTVKE